MRHTIETAPKDEKFVILEDDVAGTYDVAHWSLEAEKWIGKNSKPTELTPTHWHPLVRDDYFPREDEISSNRPAVWASAWRHRRKLCIGATVVAGLLALYAIRDIAQHDSVKIIGQVAAQATQLLSQGSKTFLPASLLTGANQTSLPGARQVQVASVPQAPPFQKEEQADALALELAEARGTIGRLDLQLREETAKSSRLLEQQAKQSSSLAQDAAAARDELVANSTRYRQGLDEERARRAAIESELATAKSEIEAQATRLRTASHEALQLAHAEAAKNLQALEQERQQSAALAQDAAAARDELVASSTRSRQALDEESTRRTAIESELATAKSEIDAQATQLRTASDEAVQLAHAVAAQNQRSLDQGRKQSDALAQEAATARTRIEPDLAGFRQALREESTRSAALESELAIARRKIETEAARLHETSTENEPPRQASAGSTAVLRQSPPQERGRAAAMAQAVAPGQAIVARATPEPAKNSQMPNAARVLAVVALPQAAVADLQSSPEATRLMARASTLLVQGDIGAARIVLESAAETGSARASFMLAETYDPAILAAWGTYGTRGEIVKARELYQKAHAGGIQEAKDRFEALRQ